MPWIMIMVSLLMLTSTSFRTEDARGKSLADMENNQLFFYFSTGRRSSEMS